MAKKQDKEPGRKVNGDAPETGGAAPESAVPTQAQLTVIGQYVRTSPSRAPMRRRPCKAPARIRSSRSRSM